MQPTVNARSMDRESTFPIKAYTPQQLAAYYNCSRKTFNKWTRQCGLGKRTGHFYTPRQVQTLVQHLGPPY